MSGTGNPADAAALAALGITDAEREKLATLYAPSKSLWRVTLGSSVHLGYQLAVWTSGRCARAGRERTRRPRRGKTQGTTCPPVNGSLIECESQTVGESVALIGTSLSLNYRSDRVPGRKSPNTLLIPLSGDTVPASLKRIDLEISIAGRTFDSEFLACRGTVHHFHLGWPGWVRAHHYRVTGGHGEDWLCLRWGLPGTQRGRGFALPPVWRSVPWRMP